MKEFYQQTKTEVRKQLNGSLKPLTDEQVKAHQEQYGKNELVEGKKKSTFQIFLEQYKDFLVVILIVAAVISGFLGDIESALVILIVITVNAILGTVQTLKAEQSLAGLKKLSSPSAKVLRNGQIVKIPSRDVTVGDEIVLEAGDQIPADGRILTSASLKVDESALTGESVAVDKEDLVLDETVALGDQKNMLFSGSFVTYGRGSFLVTATGMETEVGKIAALLKNTSEKRTPLQVNLDQFGQKLSIIIMAFCALLFGINVWQGKPIGDAFMFAVALAVAAIPEALSSIVTIVLSFGTRKMAKEGAIIRKLQAVEGLGSVSVICSDKTGTLTQNKMTVEHYYVEKKCYSADVLTKENPLIQQLLNASILCSDATVIDEKEIGDPTETALISLGNRLGTNAEKIRGKYPRISEVPFDSDRKLMSTLHNLNQGRIMITKGAVDVLLDRLTQIQIKGNVCPITEEDKKEIQRQNQEFSKKGLRVLAFAYKKMDSIEEITDEDETDYIFLGLISMMDPPRKESKMAVAECIRAGMKPVMITGDHKVTAAAIAKRIGILKDEKEACEGMEIDALSDEELQDFVEGISVYARVSPEHKIRIVRAWQEKGNIVAMTGDGVNDAPALKQADIGVAMGITGTEVSKDASSMILTDDNFATIIKAVENGRNVYENIKHSIQFLLSGNFGGILVVLYASVLALPVPFSAVHLLFINLLTDSLPAIALGLEPHTDKVMEQKPRPMNESILTKDFLLRIGMEGFVISVMTMIAYMIGLRIGNPLLARTMAFATLCMSRLVHGYNSKSDSPVIFTKRFLNNKYLAGAFLVGTILITTVVMVPGLHAMFKVQTLGIWQLLMVYGLAFLNLPIIQCLKAIICRLKKA
ncbi:ATPase [Anaerostipes sp. 494a]|uniref:cation-translocating P-type ATPase n=1 Tax=Anaerostipes sp. 494a TaxID=1261636 RepID=UPI0009528824|nr:cation-translocating P-type ATPase [Anaerostipes sp. 494a]OLR58756.1 ATPase [Anaerostipes sp. 494a]